MGVGFQWYCFGVSVAPRYWRKKSFEEPAALSQSSPATAPHPPNTTQKELAEQHRWPKYGPTTLSFTRTGAVYQRPKGTSICFSRVLLPDPHMVQLHTKNATALAQGTLETNGSSPGRVIIFGLCNPNTLLLAQEQTQASDRRHYPACSGRETEPCRRNRADMLHTRWTSGKAKSSAGFQAITQHCRQFHHG